MFDPMAKLLYHGDRVKEWLDKGRTSPVLFEVALTGFCDASCPWCFFKDQRDSHRIDTEKLMLALEDMVTLDVKAINWTGGGEPTLHPDFKHIVYHAAELGLKQGLFTNGFNKIPFQSKFEWIRISLTDRGFAPIIRPKVPFGICVNHIKLYGRQTLIKMCLQAKEMGARYFQVRPALLGSYKDQPKLEAPEYLKECADTFFDVYVTNYKYTDATEPKGYKNCYGYLFCPSIDWKGRVGTCLYLMHDKKYVLGDLNRTPLTMIWQKVTDKVKVTESCQNCCKNHEVNKILDRVKNLKAQDFI